MISYRTSLSFRTFYQFFTEFMPFLNLENITSVGDVCCKAILAIVPFVQHLAAGCIITGCTAVPLMPTDLPTLREIYCGLFNVHQLMLAERILGLVSIRGLVQIVMQHPACKAPSRRNVYGQVGNQTQIGPSAGFEPTSSHNISHYFATQPPPHPTCCFD